MQIMYADYNVTLAFPLLSFSVGPSITFGVMANESG